MAMKNMKNQILNIKMTRNEPKEKLQDSCNGAFLVLKSYNYDACPILEKETFQPLKDIHVFMKRCTVLNDTLAWDIQGNRDTTACRDIDPDTLYDLSSSKEPFKMEWHSA